jgi:hypothetical protein
MPGPLISQPDGAGYPPRGIVKIGKRIAESRTGRGGPPPTLGNALKCAITRFLGSFGPTVLRDDFWGISAS